MNVLSLLQSRFLKALDGIAPDPAACLSMIRTAQDTRFGDYQANFAMSLGKQLGKPPRDVAVQVVEKLDVSDLCETPDVAGPGFINLKLKSDWLAGQINDVAADVRCGVAKAATPKKFVIDYSSPNVAKPMHVGHLRSSVIGAALYGLLKFLGHDVLSDNHIGDWGTQFGMIIFGYKNFLDREAYERDPVGELARLYRLVNTLSDYHEAKAAVPNLTQQIEQQSAALKSQESSGDSKDKNVQKALKKQREQIDGLREELKSAQKKVEAVQTAPTMLGLAEQHPGIARAARDETARLHAGDAENNRLWNQFMPQCLSALQSMYDRLGVRFDMTLGESFYNPLLADVVADLKKKGMATESDGAICVFLEGKRAPFIVQKADGAYTYATTDLATVKYRVEKFGAQEILYIVDTRQSDHFEMLFSTCGKWGIGPVTLKHVNFGTVLGKDKKPYKTRAGDTVGLESLLDDAVAEAQQVVEANEALKREKGSDDLLAEDEKLRIAEIVGIGGVKFADLRISRDSDYEFDLKKMLAKEGDTATYMQYAYARTRGILRKAEVDPATLTTGKILLSHPTERALAMMLLRFSEALEGAAYDFRPNVLTQYLFELASAFSSFYDACDVAKEPNAELRMSRLRLTDLTGRVIQTGLSVLGIETVERM
jgi:arginyl-tRNA synthetase